MDIKVKVPHYLQYSCAQRKKGRKEQKSLLPSTEASLDQLPRVLQLLLYSTYLTY